MTLLARRYELLDVSDVEGVCWSTIKRSTAARVLREDEREDLCAWLIGIAWQASLTYERGNHESRFGRHLAELLPRRIIDYVRKERGRTKWQFSGGKSYERARPRLVSLDVDDSVRDRLEQAQQHGSVDGDPSGFADKLRALDRRSSGPGRYQDWGRDETDGRAAK